MSARTEFGMTRTGSARIAALPDRLREVDLTLATDRARVGDVEELAAYLEADGLGDEVLRARYGTAGLFDAAERLYVQRGTGQALGRRRHAQMPAFPWARAARGPLYLLPGLSGLLAARVLGPAATDAFVGAAMFGWGWTTTIGSLRYAEPFGVPGHAMRALLVLGAGAGTLGGALCAGLSGGTPDLRSAALGALVGGTVALSSGAAGVLLSLHRTGPYALAFAIPLLAAVAVTAAPTAEAALATLGLLALMPLLSALHATRPAGQLRPSWATLRPHLAHAPQGWMLALTFALLTQRLGAWTLLPLVLATGLLEGTVWHVQERLQRAARLSADLRELRRTGLPTVLLGAAAFALVPAAWAYIVPRLPIAVPALPDAWAFVGLYGAALMLSAWLANHGRLVVLTLTWACGAALMLTPVFSSSLPALCTAMTLLCAALSAFALHASLDPRSYR
ncbi:hypothetical protein HNQ07_001061 [Deinococcus metalli]|uniref:Uncharacterized protein n=1 Tax=Deinococcus metalli TaxID=1141878 RepID=A0A7W8NMA9_9DEIO|nr:hypothetical protein [Deinococcus metalli]MBB5375604.1 hypothetical protein [Deinococcus metalli]GHF38448.1 hypothetical protein GCM10017781_13970 [Deinococcus metalli]